MILRSTACRKAGTIAQVCLGKACRRSNATVPATSPANRVRPQVSTRGSAGKPLDLDSLFAHVPSRTSENQRSDDQDLVISVFESSPTKRDAKQYLQKFGPSVARQKEKSSRGSAQHGPAVIEVADSCSEHVVPHVALVKLREPQSVDDVTLKALGKTLLQLRALGMPSIVVIDCDADVVKRDEWWPTVVQQTERVLEVTGKGHTKVVDSLLGIIPDSEATSRFGARGIFVAFEELLMNPLRDASIVVVPAYAISTDTCAVRHVNANELILALTRYLSGIQFTSGPEATPPASQSPAVKAAVARVIVIDPLGGTPAKNRPNGAHMFLNMTGEFETAMEDIQSVPYPELQTTRSRNVPSLHTYSTEFIRKKHAENLELTKKILSMLPSTSSVLITTPEEAANTKAQAKAGDWDKGNKDFSFLGTTGTRKAKNPLIHNLLTDRPVHSSSLPLGRIAASQSRTDAEPQHCALSRTTLAKQGMPLTIIPDPRGKPWLPPKPGGPRLRLTDTCVDLPRLVHLIDDSFGRRLDVQHYLDRVSDSLAGIIIAGEYEGGAILTWEAPAGLGWEEAYASGRLVPYLDKFAVLRKSQGAGGVADMVFNAMVRSCFPEGVCWRSRKDNPVNRWYFERSRGFKKLGGSNWTMFWTTEWSEGRLRDYEDVCRNVQPSWADNKHIVD